MPTLSIPKWGKLLGSVWFLGMILRRNGIGIACPFNGMVIHLNS